MALSKAETKTLLQLLEEVPDHRKGNAIKYSLRDVLFLGIFAILCGAETYTEMSTFAELHLDELRKYLELPKGVPSHDVFGDIFSRVDKNAVSKCFLLFVETIRMEEGGDYVVSLEGKTVRRSANGEHRAFHIETAYLSDLEIVLGQVEIEDMGHAAVIINMFRKLCMQMLKADTSVKDSLSGKRQRCA